MNWLPSSWKFRELVRLFRFLKPYKWLFFTGIASLLISTVVSLAFPFILGELVNAISPGKTGTLSAGALQIVDPPRFDFLESRNDYALALAVILAFQGIFSFFRVYAFAKVSQESMADIRHAVYAKLLMLPVAFYDQRRVGELTSRLAADVTELQDVLSYTLAELLRQLGTVLIGIPLVAFFSPKLTLFMLAVVPIAVIMTGLFGRFIRKMSRNTQDALADTNIIVDETLQSIHTVKSFTNEGFEKNRYRKALDEVVKFGVKTAVFRGSFVAFIILAIFGAIVAVIWYGMGLIEAGNLQIGDLIAFMVYTMFIGGSIGGLGDTITRINKGMGASVRLREILDEKEESFEESSATAVSCNLKGKIEFDNIRFSYPTRADVEVIHGLSISIEPGSRVALAGPSGAGKSTIVQLLMRFYEPGGGEIRIDGVPIRQINLNELRKNTGIVPQEVLLFGGTIRENIEYGKPGAGMDEIIAAARKANAMEFIETFPDKFETIVGERGVKLSGGQRQRIAIARAVLRDPAILILDEATNSLDAASEKLVQEALNSLMDNRTTIVIAHRLATIRKVDRIFVIEKGVVTEQGTHDELSNEQGGLYQNLLRLQYQD